MIEIFYIFTEIFFILIIFSIPILYIDKNYYLKSLKFTLIDKLSISLIFIINILFFVSILNIKSGFILYFYFFVILILIFNYLKKNSFKKIKINYLLLILLLFTFLISLDIADQIYFEWDAKSNWIFKTLSFYQDKKIENLSKFNNSDYPHLGSFLWSFFWKFPHNNFEYLGRIFYAFIYVLSILSLANCLKTEIFEKLIFSILLILLTYSYELFSGLQDVLVFSSMLIFSRISYLIFSENSKINKLPLIIILLGLINMLCWFKNEGIFYSLFLLISLLLTYRFSKNEKLYLILGSISIFLLRIFIFNYYNTDLNPDYFEIEKTVYSDFALIINKLKTITFYMIIYLTQNLTYLISFPILIYLIYKYSNKNIISFILYFLILNFSFIYLTYMFKMTEVELLIKASMSRVIFQTSGFYLLIIVIYLNNSLRITRK